MLKNLNIGSRLSAALVVAVLATSVQSKTVEAGYWSCMQAVRHAAIEDELGTHGYWGWAALAGVGGTVLGGLACAFE